MDDGAQASWIDWDRPLFKIEKTIVLNAIETTEFKRCSKFQLMCMFHSVLN